MRSGSSFMSSSDLRLQFGLGESASVATIAVDRLLGPGAASAAAGLGMRARAAEEARPAGPYGVRSVNVAHQAGLTDTVYCESSEQMK